MFREENNLKDSSATNLGLSIKDNRAVVSYSKTNKLITALYMVTDILEKDEPLRKKLRTLGTEIISDMTHKPSNACGKISEIMSFLDIASAVNVISEMNSNILKKEFSELNESIKEATLKSKEISKKINIAEYFENFSSGEEKQEEPSLSFKQLYADKGQKNSKGHTSIGVQKGSTLLKALSKVSVPSRPTGGMNTKEPRVTTGNFDGLKKQRRDEICSIIQKRGEGATITDIKNAAFGSLVSCGEKTLQRELVSMIKDNLLSKTGEKRWSRYFLKK